MNVAFWNGISSADSVNHYVAAIGIMMAIEQNSNIILSSNYISNRMLQDCFSSKVLEEGIAHAPYCYSYGTSEYFGALWSLKHNRQGNIQEIPMEGVTIIYPPDVEEKMFYFNSSPHDFYFMDMAKGNISVSKKVLEEADFIVVFLSQDEYELQNFFERFSSLISQVIFVIVDCHRDVGVFCRKLESFYRVNRNNIGIIRYNREFKEACETGDLLQFIRESRRVSTREQRYNFIMSLRRVARRIYERELTNCKGAEK